MPKIDEATEQTYVEHIKSIVAYNPKAGRVIIRNILRDKHEITLDLEYIAKLKGGIFTKRAEEISNARISKTIAEHENLLAFLVKELKDIMDSTEDEKVKVVSIKTIMDAAESNIRLQLTAGIFDGKDEDEDDKRTPQQYEADCVEIIKDLINDGKVGIESIKQIIKELDVIPESSQIEGT